MKTAFKTDTGRVRDMNEDAILSDAESGIFILADGMGGHQAGEVASAIAVKEAHEYLKDHLGEITEAGAEKLLAGAAYTANMAVFKKSRTDASLSGMGTTFVAVLIQEDEANICNVGDSRAYLVRDEIRQLTIDHTVAEEFFQKGLLTKNDISGYYRHILTRALGISEYIEPELFRLEIKKGDILILCSDGLTDMIDDGGIMNIIKKNYDDINAAADELVNEANNKGGRDNISLIVIKND